MANFETPTLNIMKVVLESILAHCTTNARLLKYQVSYKLHKKLPPDVSTYVQLRKKHAKNKQYKIKASKL